MSAMHAPRFNTPIHLSVDAHPLRNKNGTILSCCPLADRIRMMAVFI